jgi:hypothetical protein
MGNEQKILAIYANLIWSDIIQDRIQFQNKQTILMKANAHIYQKAYLVV